MRSLYISKHRSHVGYNSLHDRPTVRSHSVIGDRLVTIRHRSTTSNLFNVTAIAPSSKNAETSSKAHEADRPAQVRRICRPVPAVRRESCQSRCVRRQSWPCTRHRWFDPTRSAAATL